jgi:biopolymer transport protein ExbD
MAMQTGSQAQINMTPLIDVLLVLLIIFMAITPTKSIGLDGKVPQPAPTISSATPPENDLVITIRANGSLELNSHAVSREKLARTLTQALAMQPGRAVFVKGDKELEYRDVAAVIDTARGAGAQRIGLLTGL